MTSFGAVYSITISEIPITNAPKIQAFETIRSVGSYRALSRRSDLIATSVIIPAVIPEQGTINFKNLDKKDLIITSSRLFQSLILGKHNVRKSRSHLFIWPASYTNQMLMADGGVAYSRIF